MEEEKLTFADIMRGFAESKKRNDEVSAQMAATAARIAQTEALIAATDAQISRTDAQIAQTDAQISRTDAQMVATDARFAKTEALIVNNGLQLAELKLRIEDMSAEVKGIGKSNGMFAEDVYYRSLWRQKELAGIHFDEVTNSFGGIKKLPDGTRLQDQFDIVMVNDTAVAIIETKYRGRGPDVEKLVGKKVDNFKTLFPDYKDFKVYVGIGALAFEDDVVQKARKYGVGLLKRVGDTIEYAADWEVKAY
jgi:hypothetical protein